MGLSTVAAINELHGANLTLSDGPGGRGVAATVRFPHIIGLGGVGVMATVALATAIVSGGSARKTVKARTETYRGERVIEGEVVR